MKDLATRIGEAVLAIVSQDLAAGANGMARAAVHGLANGHVAPKRLGRPPGSTNKPKATADDVLAFVRENPGVSATRIRKALRLSRGEWSIRMRALRLSGKLRASGERSQATYEAV